MAKYVSSGLIHNIRGSFGDSVFSSWRGIPRICKKPTKKKQLHPLKSWESLVTISSNWKNLSFQEWALWEEYTKSFREIKTHKYDGLCTAIGNRMSAYNAYVSTNQLLVLSGFNSIRKPCLGNIPSPPFPSTDLANFGSYTNQIKFNIWLPRSYPAKCVVQIWIRKAIAPANPYIAKILKVSTSKTEVVINEIKLKEKDENIEKKFEKMKNCKILLQMRTIAQNGKFSQPGPIYKIQLN